MYVCMCVCMYVYLYVCTFVCMYSRLYVCILFNQIQKKNTNSTEIHKCTNDFAATIKNSLKYEEFR